MKREEISELIQHGISELGEALAEGKSDRLKQYLDTMAQFPCYSFKNCMLIAQQFPSATLIQGFHAWRKMGRTVRKGEKGIGIIAPMIGKKKGDDEVRENGAEKRAIFGFKVVHVFDVSQTEGDDLPDVADVSGDPGQYLAAIEWLTRDWGIKLTYDDILTGADGLSKKGEVVIARGLSPAKRLLTIAHEVAHERLHCDRERRANTTKTSRETEAEAVAYVVGRSLGLDALDHCADYIQLYDGDAEVFAKSMECIQKTAAEILKGVHEYLAAAAPRQSEAAT